MLEMMSQLITLNLQNPFVIYTNRGYRISDGSGVTILVYDLYCMSGFLAIIIWIRINESMELLSASLSYGFRSHLSEQHNLKSTLSTK